MSYRINYKGHLNNMAGLENIQITNKSYITTTSYRTSMSLIKNLQQITMAVYMVTDCVEDPEPLRYEARTAVLNAMKSISKVMGNVQLTSSEFRNAHANMILLRNHISVLEIMGFVSNMNANILMTEIDHFISKLDSSILDIDSPHESRVPLRSDMSFGIDLGELFYNKTPENALENIENNPNDNETKDGKNTLVGNSINKIEIQMSRLKRRSLILKLFREIPSVSGFKELTVGELVDKYSRYGGEGQISEKTIQRELIELTQDGTLEKVGTKRWARYRLIHSSK